MTLSPFEYLISQLVTWTDVAAVVFVAVLCGLAFFHCLARTKAVQFQRAFKRTRNFWLAATGACFAVIALVLAMILTGQLASSSSYFVALITATVCGVYLADVKPAVDVESSGPSAW